MIRKIVNISRRIILKKLLRFILKDSIMRLESPLLFCSIKYPESNIITKDTTRIIVKIIKNRKAF
jgi:hypothetical protein